MAEADAHKRLYKRSGSPRRRGNLIGKTLSDIGFPIIRGKGLSNA
ncbi:MAG TPA: hypothetical protein VM008_08575 [Phycisphaerae bacterium]|nr:hypothetical protein [Phycisphaerae bacterium]